MLADEPHDKITDGGDLYKLVAKRMLLPAWVLLLTVKLANGEDTVIKADSLLQGSWWDANTLYNLACFYARRYSLQHDEADLQCAKDSLAEAIDRADEPQLLSNMADCDPSLDDVHLDEQVKAALLGQKPDEYAADVKIGHGWGLRLHEAFKTGILGQGNEKTMPPAAGSTATGSLE